jgi:hypothetical protein
VQVARAAEGLAEVAAMFLAQVVDDDDGDVMLALEGPEEAQERRDFVGTILIAGMKADQGIEHEEAGLIRIKGSAEASLISGVVQAQGRSGDAVQVERFDGEAAVCAQRGDALAHTGQSILG